VLSAEVLAAKQRSCLVAGGTAEGLGAASPGAAGGIGSIEHAIKVKLFSTALSAAPVWLETGT